MFAQRRLAGPRFSNQSTGSTMPASQPRLDDARRQRYEKVLAAMLAQPEFTLVELRGGVASESAPFVTHLVRALERDGHLERFEREGGSCFRWAHPREKFSVSAWIDGRIYGPTLPRTPPADRPRERLLAHGAAALRTAELLAILVRSGRPGESALQAGERVAARFADCLDKLPAAGRGELHSISPAINVTAYCQIMAGIELGRRIAATVEAKPTNTPRIHGTQDAVAFCQEHFARLAADGAQEECHVVSLDTKQHILGTHRIAIGSLDSSTLQAREVFRPAIKDAAAAIVLVHNHPSGDPTPSPEDLSVTRRLEEAGKSLGIDLLDHVIVARTGALSIREYRTYA